MPDKPRREQPEQGEPRQLIGINWANGSDTYYCSECGHTNEPCKHYDVGAKVGDKATERETPQVYESQAAARANLGGDSKTAASDEAGRPLAPSPEGMSAEQLAREEAELILMEAKAGGHDRRVAGNGTYHRWNQVCCRSLCRSADAVQWKM